MACLAVSAFAADFEKSNVRAQIYFGAIPYYQMDFQATGVQSLNDKQVVPLQMGVLVSPLFSPLFKLDLPLTIWLGFEAGNIAWATLYDKTNIDSAFSTERLDWNQWMPTLTGAISTNIYGDFDLRLTGGIGWIRSSFEHTIVAGNSDIITHSDFGYFGAVHLEYVAKQNIFNGADLKVAVFARQDAQSVHDVKAVRYDTTGLGPTVRLSHVDFSRIEQTRLKFGLEVSMEFGRESRADRKVRFQLRNRTNELRKHNQGMDTLTEWDCMAIERDYKFFLAPDGQLPDVRGKYTKSQFTDVLESFLAFCPQENLHTREALYASLDSNKVQLKHYQMSQEESRYKQVMASNDTSYLKMFLQYYPKSRHRQAVLSKIAVLGDYGVFRAARAANTYRDYLQYLSKFPEGHYRKEAEMGIFALVQAGNRQKDYEIYLKKFPNGLFVNEAHRALHEILKQTAVPMQ